MQASMAWAGTRGVGCLGKLLQSPWDTGTALPERTAQLRAALQDPDSSCASGWVPPIHRLSPAQPFTPCALTAFLPPHLPPHVYEQPAHMRVSMCHPMSHTYHLQTCDSAAQPPPSAAFGGTPHIHDIPHASRPEVMAGCPQLPGPAYLSVHTSWAQGSGPPTAEMGPPSRAYGEGC